MVVRGSTLVNHGSFSTQSTVKYNDVTINESFI